MADKKSSPREDPPLQLLAVNIRCDPPPAGLTTEQKMALHEYFHVVLAATYKLLQIVPYRDAAPILKKKFGLVIKDLS